MNREQRGACPKNEQSGAKAAEVFNTVVEKFVEKAELTPVTFS